MSVTIYVVAQKQLTKTDFTKVDLYNGLWENGYEPPEKTQIRIGKHFGA